MFIGLWAVDALAAADVEVVLLLLLLHAASASPAAVTAAMKALRRRHRRVAGKDGTAILLCALSLGCGLAVVPVSRAATRLTGFHAGQLSSASIGWMPPSYEPPL